MKLEFEQIISAANGVVRSELNDTGLELHRFTREQEGFFHKTHPLFCNEYVFNGYFGKNCRTCAGITLDFISDATKIRIEFGKIEHTHDTRGQLFDLYVDNKFIQSYESRKDIIYIANGEKHRFTWHFPYFAFPVISSMELEDATVFVPQNKHTDILFLGDSITHGASALHPSNTYVSRVARELDIGIVNQGNSGFVYDSGSIDKACEPKIIVTAYGINDYMRKTPQLIEKETNAFFKS